MKKIYITIFAALIMACENRQSNHGSNATSTQDTVKIFTANWELDTLQELVNKYYIENAIKQSQMYMEIKDELTKKIHNVRLTGFEDTVYRTAEGTGYVTARMQEYHLEDKGDTLKFDFQIVWKLEKGKYELGKKYVRKYKTQDRYFWEKRDKYYERITPEEKSVLSEQNT